MLIKQMFSMHKDKITTVFFQNLRLSLNIMIWTWISHYFKIVCHYFDLISHSFDRTTHHFPDITITAHLTSHYSDIITCYFQKQYSTLNWHNNTSLLLNWIAQFLFNFMSFQTIISLFWHIALSLNIWNQNLSQSNLFNVNS